MSFLELFLTGVGLSMDAFAVSLCRGLRMKRINWRHALVIALFFGAFQALMPVLGWLLGMRFERLITSFDHWVVFALLAFIGGKMIWESRGSADAEAPCENGALDIKELLVLAVATSIDALAVGISFAFLGVAILPAAGLIGVVTFALCLAGVALGNRFGVRYQKRAELAGGVILVLIGTKILLEHLGVL